MIFQRPKNLKKACDPTRITEEAVHERLKAHVRVGEDLAYDIGPVELFQHRTQGFFFAGRRVALTYDYRAMDGVIRRTGQNLILRTRTGNGCYVYAMPVTQARPLTAIEIITIEEVIRGA